jgi:hypothetical protein
VDPEDLVRLQNRFMIGFDLLLGSATLIAPRSTLRLLGHDEPSPEVIAGFRRLSWVWLTFSAAHANAERRGNPEDWFALAWLRGTEMLADPIWSSSPGWRRPGSRASLWFSGVANTAMSLGFGWLATRPRPKSRRLLPWR